MKSLVIFLLSLCLSIPMFAEDKPKEVKSTIKHVTVFTKGAQVSREAKANIPRGNSIIKFVGISPSIDKNSIQVKADGNFTVLSVVHQLNNYQSPVKSEEIEKLQAAQLKLQDKVEDENTLLLVLNEEESLIISNKTLGGQQTRIQIDELRATAEFYRSRLKEIRLEKLGISRKVKDLQKKIAEIQSQLTKLNQRERFNFSEIVLAISSKNATSGKFLISYLVNSAGWTPHYDLRVKDVKSPVQLSYKANVYQTSGESWDDILLTLSTGDPSQSGTKPVLNPWLLNFYVAYAYQKNRRAEMAKDSGLELDEVTVTGYGIKKEDYASNPLSVQEIEKATTVSFKIDLPYNIPSDGKQYVVQMKDHELPASYEYYCAPKLDPDAFLTAQITGWEALNLLSGEASLFFEGTYLGKSYLDVQSVEDTLDLSLGRDKSIVVKRTRQKQNTKKKFMSNKRIDTRGWDIEVRNKKKLPIYIVIEDQIPIAVTEEIEVEKEYKGAAFDKDTGKLTWKFDLQSNSTKKLNFKYTVKYPKKKQVRLE